MHFVKAKGILSQNNGINVYRGCTHGCIYCDSRSLCYQNPQTFEDIEVKENAPQLLESALRSRRKRCMIGTGAMCDPYIHAEAELKITRRCLELISRYEFGAAMLTKSDLIMRDIDLLDEINRKTRAVVQMTLTTADEEICRIIEPNVCTTARRFEVLCEMRERGIPTVVWFSPLLPFINDTEENVLKIVDCAKRAGCYGIMCFGMGLTLREGNREYFYAALDRHFPGLKERYMQRFVNYYELPSPDTARLMKLFHEECAKAGLESDSDKLFRYLREFPECEQLTLF